MEDKELNKNIVDSLFAICLITGTIFWFGVIVMGLYKLIEIITK